MWFFFKVKCWNDIDGDYNNEGAVIGKSFDDACKRIVNWYGTDLIDLELSEGDEDILLKEEMIERFKENE